MEETQVKTKFCKYCGAKIPEDAVMCTVCGRQVEELKTNKLDNIIINNSSSASAAASASSNNARGRRHYSLLLDIIMLFVTGGLWIFWMIFRPKYY